MTSDAPDFRHDRDPQTVAARAQNLDWSALRRAMHRDPGGRGLAGYRRHGKPLDSDPMRAAALDLANRACKVAIVTGFCAIAGEHVTAETDGPPGALFLRRYSPSWAST